MIKFNAKHNFRILLIIVFTASFLVFGFFSVDHKKDLQDDRFVTFEVNPKTSTIQMFWRNEKGENFRNAATLQDYVKSEHKTLFFAMNGGMYRRDGSPQGLYIEKGAKKSEIDTLQGNGNFYLKPNGIFYITSDKKAIISDAQYFKMNSKIIYATQSGPMLVVDGKIHSAFKENSTNINIRNGVGILPNHHVVFAMSKKEINFYDFATYFKNIGCKNALYLDGFVSRTYLPEKNWKQTDGNFGVIIGIAK